MRNILSRVSVVALSLILPVVAQAVPRTCPAVFAGEPAAQRQTPQAAAAPAAAAAVAAKKPGKPGTFDLEIFAAKRDRFVKNGVGPKDRPKTAEEKAALIAATLQLTGRRDVVNLEQWLQTADKRDIAKLVKAVGKIDPRKGIGPKRAENLFLDILAITHHENASFKGLLTKGFKSQEKLVLLKWARTEFAQKPFIEALDGLGLLKDPGVRDVLRRRMAKHPNVGNMVNTVFFNSFFMTLFPAQFMGVPVPYHAPKLSVLKRGVLVPTLRAKITRKGIDESYDALYARYGKLARFQTAWSYARHVATGAAMAYAITQIYPGFMTSLLPPNYIDPEKDGALEMGVKVWDHYTRMALLIRWEGIKEMIWPAEENRVSGPTIPATPIAPQPDLIAPDMSAEAATDQSLDAAEPNAPVDTDYAPPTFDPAPDMPADPVVSEMPSSSDAAAVAAADEPSSDVLEF